MKRTFLVFLIALAALCVGLLIYTSTRTEALYINQWTATLSGHSLKSFLQDLFSGLTYPSWFVYSLPDGLWMMALMLVIMMIWNFKFNSQSIPWYIGTFLAGILFEAGQAFQWVSGTFDIIDLCFLCIGALLPILFTFLKTRVWQTA